MISFAKYYRKLVREVTGSLSELIENFDENAVHNMRVAYKKIRAMNSFILAEFGGKKNIRDQIRILDAIYKNTGIIREIQVSKKLSDKFKIKPDKSLDELFDYLDTRLTETKLVLKEQVRSIDIDGIKRYEGKMNLVLKEANEKRMFAKAVKFIKKG